MTSFNYSTKNKVIGIDLHGTLLNKDWSVSPDSLPDLLASLSDINLHSHIYICSGNDLNFVQEVLPAPVREFIDGYILENGCVFSDGKKEHLLISPQQVSMIKSLQEDLHQHQLPEVLFYGHRLGTISLFTKDRDRGVSPHNLFLYLKDYLKSHHSFHDIHITHSDVAVDILPEGNSKFNGLSMVCPLLQIIAIADSCNDWEFLSQADYSFIPQNASPHLEKKFLLHGFSIKHLTTYQHDKNNKTIYKSDQPYTLGVIEILQKINQQQE